MLAMLFGCGFTRSELEQLCDEIPLLASGVGAKRRSGRSSEDMVPSCVKSALL
jgi:hypothetical protein